MTTRGTDRAAAPSPPPDTPEGERPGGDAGALMRVTVEVEGRRFERDLAAQAVITPNIEGINEDLSVNPGRFAEWAMLEAAARAVLDGLVSDIANADADVKDLEATLYLEWVEAPVLPGGKALTVDGVKAKVQVDPRRKVLTDARRALEARRLAAKDDLERVAVGRKTMEQKKDSLLEMSRNWREEMQTTLGVRAPNGARPGLGAARPGGRPAP